jgi:spore coat polysaccharide biosynthesis protein SpsF
MILTILQARVSSSRLPQKVLKKILELPMLEHQINRIKQAKLINKLIIATSDHITDVPIVDLCQKLDVNCFQGSLHDVLDRFYQLAYPLKPDHIVRLTADCPLCDPELIDQIIKYHLDGKFDYTSNTIEPTYPDGLDVEVFRFSCLIEAWERAKLPSEREHVTSFIHTQPQLYHIGSYKNKIDLSDLRWTVDEDVDFVVISKIYESLYPKNSGFATQDILDFLQSNPELKTLNTYYQRNEGYKKSLLIDEEYIKNKLED